MTVKERNTNRHIKCQTDPKESCEVQISNTKLMILTNLLFV